jgi:hypothetical protein
MLLVQLDSPQGLALDLVNGEVFVTNQNDSITVYSRTATGNASR